ncbi:TIGR02996 domain-containing protein [Thermogemmata fonticola]|uniref:TIGR02996 domain-containing protein n=1 Tax=Thermogemmata fonticola TaxID=2755323 RepID=A0A7V9AC13_9BACT|nr:TIGR02996 domain-containing protein [Thermogemmata fonticola]MBA2226791.1 TIGR02996 domain-containing protein [Thermogemmata fonticola]
MTRMNEHNHFQQLLWNNPDDDLPYLIYADWLEERGEAAQAEYLRLECRLRQLAGHDSELLDGIHRRIELSLALPSAWLAVHRRFTEVDFWHWPQRERCYQQPTPPVLCALSCCQDVQAARRHVNKVRQKGLYRAVEILVNRNARPLHRLQEIPELGDYDILIVRLMTEEARWVRPALQALTHFPPPVRWKTLFLECSDWTAEIVEWLQEAPAWQGLRHLHLLVFPTSGLDEPHLWQRLYQAHWLRHLRGLRLQLPSPQAYESLLACGPWPHVQWLEWDLLDLLAHVEQVEVPLGHLAQAFPNLRGLRVMGGLATPGKAQESSGAWPHLRFLDLRPSRNAPALLGALQAQPLCTQLQELSLMLPADFPKQLLVQFFTGTRWPALRSLSLWGPVASVRLWQAIRSHPDLQQLRYLHLGGVWSAPEAPQTVRTLFRYGSLPHLLHLGLSGLAVSASSVQDLVARHCHNLRLLNLGACRLLGKTPLRRRFRHPLSYPHIFWPASLQ